MPSPRSALLSAHVAAVLFGLTGIFGALIHAGPLVITLGRAVFAVVFLSMLAVFQRGPLLTGIPRRQAGLLLLTGLLLAVHWVTFFIAVKTGGVAVATLGFASFPAFIALLDVGLFRDRLRLAEVLLLALITAGLILVTPSFDMADGGTLGLLWGLASGLSFAGLAVANRRGTRQLPALQVAFWQNAIVAGLVLPFALAGPLTLPAATDWLYLALLGLFCTGLSQFLFIRSLTVLDARKAGIIIALEPVYAIACAWWLFDEQPSARMLAGAAIIISATVLSARTGSTA